MTVVGEALEIFRLGKNNFGDALLLAEARAHGVAHFMPFDETLLAADKRAMRVG